MKELEKFDKATDELARAFIVKYFDKEYEEDDDYYWVGTQDEDREVLAVGDYFFNLDRIVDALRYKATEQQLFNYYDIEIEEDGGTIINFKNYVKQTL